MTPLPRQSVWCSGASSRTPRLPGVAALQLAPGAASGRAGARDVDPATARGVAVATGFESHARTGAATGAAAFTLTEILVAVVLMSVIIFALYSMFNQTQKALRGNVTQVDVLETARAALDFIVRDIEQATHCEVPGATNLYARNAFNEKPTYQPLSDGSSRTNFFQELFFLTRSNNYHWYANAFFVASLTNPAARVGPLGVGTLYRFSAPVARLNPLMPPTNRIDLRALRDTMELFERVKTDPSFRTTVPYTYPLLSGVTHLKWQAYDGAGRRLAFQFGVLVSNVWVAPEPEVPGESWFAFTNPVPTFQVPAPALTNALPATLEMEIGVLEAEALQRLKSMGSAQLARSFLEKQAGRVHVFKQQIAIRTVPR